MDENNQIPNRLLTVAEASATVGRTRQAINLWLKAGLRWDWSGGKRVIYLSDLLDYQARVPAPGRPEKARPQPAPIEPTEPVSAKDRLKEYLKRKQEQS